MDSQGPQSTLPLVEERLRVEKVARPQGSVRVTTSVQERAAQVDEDLLHEEVEIERVQIGREVDAVPEVREEGDVLIYPVVEEILVVEKRLVLKEEVRLRRVRRVERLSEEVMLRSEHAVVERVGLHTDATQAED
jgi:uncharacterized protein (TIGR02271 family)